MKSSVDFIQLKFIWELFPFLYSFVSWSENFESASLILYGPYTYYICLLKCLMTYMRSKNMSLCVSNVIKAFSPMTVMPTIHNSHASQRRIHKNNNMNIMYWRPEHVYKAARDNAQHYVSNILSYAIWYSFVYRWCVVKLMIFSSTVHCIGINDSGAVLHSIHNLM